MKSDVFCLGCKGKEVIEIGEASAFKEIKYRQLALNVNMRKKVGSNMIHFLALSIRSVAEFYTFKVCKAVQEQGITMIRP